MCYQLLENILCWKNIVKNLEFQEDFRNEIGVDCENNVWVDKINKLYIKKIPEGTRNQFCGDKHGKYYQSKRKGALNQKFIKLMDKYGVRKYSVADLIYLLGENHGVTSAKKFDERIFLIATNPTDFQVNKLFGNSQLTIIKEEDYLAVQQSFQTE